MATSNRTAYPIRTIQQTNLHLAIMRGLYDPRAYFGLMTEFCGTVVWHA